MDDENFEPIDPESAEILIAMAATHGLCGILESLADMCEDMSDEAVADHDDETSADMLALKDLIEAAQHKAEKVGV